MFRTRPIAVFLMLTLVIAACGSQGTSDESRPTVVATTSVLGDIVSNVVGDDADVTTLMAPGVDPHDFQPSARQVEEAADADLVVAIGLGLEESLIDTMAAATEDPAALLEIGELVDPLPFSEHLSEHDQETTEGEEGEHHHGDLDPHVWLDPIRMATAARLIGEHLTEIAPDIDWQTRAEAYAAELEALDAEVVDILAPIPDDDRVLVTNHDALGYFADRYGFEVLGTVIPGGTTLAEPSAADLADLIATMRAAGVTAVFAETTNPTALADTVAAELGEDVGVYELATGSLGEPGSASGTYIGMIRTDAETIAEALS